MIDIKQSLEQLHEYANNLKDDENEINDNDNNNNDHSMNWRINKQYNSTANLIQYSLDNNGNSENIAGFKNFRDFRYRHRLTENPELSGEREHSSKLLQKSYDKFDMLKKNWEACKDELPNHCSTFNQKLIKKKESLERSCSLLRKDSTIRLVEDDEFDIISRYNPKHPSNFRLKQLENNHNKEMEMNMEEEEEDEGKKKKGVKNMIIGMDQSITDDLTKNLLTRLSLGRLPSNSSVSMNGEMTSKNDNGRLLTQSIENFTLIDEPNPKPTESDSESIVELNLSIDEIDSKPIQTSIQEVKEKEKVMPIKKSQSKKLIGRVASTTAAKASMVTGNNAGAGTGSTAGTGIGSTTGIGSATSTGNMTVQIKKAKAKSTKIMHKSPTPKNVSPINSLLSLNESGGSKLKKSMGGIGKGGGGEVKKIKKNLSMVKLEDHEAEVIPTGKQAKFGNHSRRRSLGNNTQDEFTRRKSTSNLLSLISTPIEPTIKTHNTAESPSTKNSKIFWKKLPITEKINEFSQLDLTQYPKFSPRTYLQPIEESCGMNEYENESHRFSKNELKAHLQEKRALMKQMKQNLLNNRENTTNTTTTATTTTPLKKLGSSLQGHNNNKDLKNIRDLNEKDETRVKCSSQKKDRDREKQRVGVATNTVGVVGVMTKIHDKKDPVSITSINNINNPSNGPSHSKILSHNNAFKTPKKSSNSSNKRDIQASGGGAGVGGSGNGSGSNPPPTTATTTTSTTTTTTSLTTPNKTTPLRIGSHSGMSQIPEVKSSHFMTSGHKLDFKGMKGMNSSLVPPPLTTTATAMMMMGTTTTTATTATMTTMATTASTTTNAMTSTITGGSGGVQKALFQSKNMALLKKIDSTTSLIGHEGNEDTASSSLLVPVKKKRRNSNLNVVEKPPVLAGSGMGSGGGAGGSGSGSGVINAVMSTSMVNSIGNAGIIGTKINVEMVQTLPTVISDNEEPKPKENKKQKQGLTATPLSTKKGKLPRSNATSATKSTNAGIIIKDQTPIRKKSRPIMATESHSNNTSNSNIILKD